MAREVEVEFPAEFISGPYRVLVERVPVMPLSNHYSRSSPRFRGRRAWPGVLRVVAEGEGVTAVALGVAVIGPMSRKKMSFSRARRQARTAP